MKYYVESDPYTFPDIGVYEIEPGNRANNSNILIYNIVDNHIATQWDIYPEDEIRIIWSEDEYGKVTILDRDKEIK